jgi:hypothetical protein
MFTLQLSDHSPEYQEFKQNIIEVAKLFPNTAPVSVGMDLDHSRTHIDAACRIVTDQVP